MIDTQHAEYATRAVHASREAARARARHHAESARATAETVLAAKELLPAIRWRYRFQDTPAAQARRRAAIA